MKTITVEEASALILETVEPLAEEDVKLGDAVGRVLAQDVRSPVTLPPWDNAGMDGYAVRSADLMQINAMLPVAGVIAAGARTASELAAGTAMRIMTGAPLPAGADTVIRVEDTDRGTDFVRINDLRDLRKNIRLKGSELQKGDIAVYSGTVLGPAQMGVLASVGAAKLRAHKVPSVAVIASGDELVDLDKFSEVEAGHAIVSSNSYTLRAAAGAAGAAVADYGIVRDDPRALANRIHAARTSDLIVTSGGVSVGAFDHTRDVVRGLGGDVRIDRVRMRPGAPLAFGLIKDVPWLGLPGNPVSALVTFELFARPVIRRLRGEHAIFPLPVPVIVDESIELQAPLTHFLRCVVRPGEDGELHAKLTGSQSSAILTSMTVATGLLIVPHDRERVGVGARLYAFLAGPAGPRRSVFRSMATVTDDLEAQLDRRFRMVNTPVDLEAEVEVNILHPANADDLISEEDFVRDERLPYWADLWPSAKMLSRSMMDEHGSGKRLLELGCGSGLVSVAAVVAGYDVLASDYYADALLFTRLNVERNVKGKTVRTREIDWRDLPKGLGRFDRVVAADVLYEPAHGELVARAIAKTLADDGFATVADPGRLSRQNFIDRAGELGLDVEMSRKLKFAEGEIRQEITLIDLRWPLVRRVP